MTIYCLYVFDRHCNCVYYHDWHRTKRPKRANDGGGLLPGVSHALSPLPSSSAAGSAPGTPFSSPRNTLASNSGVLVAFNDGSQSPSGVPTSSATPPPPVQAQGGAGGAASGAGLPFDEEAKLVYGVILSLRNMVKRLSGRDESFVSYRTSTYKLHLFETVSGYRLVMLSDPNAESLRFVMRSIYTGPFLEYVVRNPLVPMDSRVRGVDNEYLRASIDRLVRGLSVFQ
ncbi:TRAPP complex subunit bet5 [Russula ochroleuca]|uniref:Trafficking protein particle complex subunit n=1 Tax=Russula ochroleuca TaxID=152965 RepID=A0A9P5MZV2_9AGAM|nr:TRAPP complex subunit bet5 [Russula ochroleuca]